MGALCGVWKSLSNLSCQIIQGLKCQGMNVGRDLFHHLRTSPGLTTSPVVLSQILNPGSGFWSSQPSYWNLDCFPPPPLPQLTTNYYRPSRNFPHIEFKMHCEKCDGLESISLQRFLEQVVRDQNTGDRPRGFQKNNELVCR